MITFVVPTLGERCNEFERLLASLDKQTDKRFELIVVSQGNYDQVEQWLSAFQLRSTHIKLGEKGLSRARNAAWPALKGDIVSFSDDDCWYPLMQSNWYTAHLRKKALMLTAFKFMTRSNKARINTMTHRLALSEDDAFGKSPPLSCFSARQQLNRCALMKHSGLAERIQAEKKTCFCGNF